MDVPLDRPGVCCIAAPRRTYGAARKPVQAAIDCVSRHAWHRDCRRVLAARCVHSPSEATGSIRHAVLDIPIGSAAFIYVFLPVLLFQAALNIDVRQMAEDVVTVLTLAVLAVVIATFVIGLALWPYTGRPTARMPAARSYCRDDRPGRGHRHFSRCGRTAAIVATGRRREPAERRRGGGALRNLHCAARRSPMRSRCT